METLDGTFSEAQLACSVRARVGDMGGLPDLNRVCGEPTPCDSDSLDIHN